MFSVVATVGPPEALTEALERVLCAEEVAAMADLDVRVEREARLVEWSGVNCVCNRSISSTSATNFACEVTRPPSSQPADCQTTFAPARKAACNVFIDS